MSNYSATGSTAPGTSWVRQLEHGVCKAGALLLSLSSAKAIFWFFSWLDWVDPSQVVFTWGFTIGFALLGYVVARGLAHRLINHEKPGIYTGICCLFEFVEVACNCSQAAVTVPHMHWIRLVPSGMQQGTVALAFVVLSIYPLLTVLLAWVDMDLGGGSGNGSSGTGSWVRAVEHIAVRLTSFIFAAGSAHAVYWFFQGLNWMDSFEWVFTGLTALALGLLGYVVSRGLAHRLLRGERHLGPYLSLGLVLLLIEGFSNFLEASIVVPHLPWLLAVPAAYVAGYTVAAFMVLSIVPVTTLMLAWVDMDLDRAKGDQGGAAGLP